MVLHRAKVRGMGGLWQEGMAECVGVAPDLREGTTRWGGHGLGPCGNALVRCHAKVRMTGVQAAAKVACS